MVHWGMASRRDSSAIRQLLAALRSRNIDPLPRARSIEDWIHKGIAPSVRLPLAESVIRYFQDLAPLLGRGKTATGVLVNMAYRGHHEIITERIGRSRFERDFEDSLLPVRPTKPKEDVEDFRDRISLPIRDVLASPTQ